MQADRRLHHRAVWMKRRRQRAPGAPVRAAPGVLVQGELKVDLDCFRVTFRGRPVHLGPTPYRLLTFLLRRPGIHTRKELIAALWPAGTQIRPSTVDMHVLRLRAALAGAGGSDLIACVRGLGYGLSAPSDLASESPKDRGPKVSAHSRGQVNRSPREAGRTGFQTENG
jgi:DNA-binding response OmpR family regulator